MRGPQRFALVSLFVVLGVAGTARAQGGALDIQQFHPAMDSKGHLSVDTTQTLSPGMFSLGLTANFAYNALQLSGSGGHSFDVKFLTSANLQFAIGVMKLGRLPFMEVGFGLPVNITTGKAKPLAEQIWDQDPKQVGVQAPLKYEQNGNFSAQGMGDTYFSIKLRFLAATQSPVGLGAMFTFSIPTSHWVAKGDQHLMGAGGVMLWPKLLVDRFLDKAKKMLLSGNIGFRMRVGTDGELRENPGWNTCTSGPCQFVGEDDNAETKRVKGLYELTYGVGLNWTLVQGRIDWVSELYGSIEFASLAAGKNYTKRVFPMELLTGLKLYLATNSFLAVAGGVGLTGVGPLNNVGAPDFRVLASFVFEPLIGDRDGDGIKDDVDRCPDDPEDFDDFEDRDGCPEPDNDRDGILDVNDRCPNEPGPGTVDGCPAQKALDRDGDGINDNLDKCPDDPEDVDGFQDKDGCPDLDNDNDGVPDADDQCPGKDADKVSGFAKTAEDIDGFQDTDGCPDPDNDHDRICDDNQRIQKHLAVWEKVCKGKDICPDEPETYNRYKDTDGCPDKPRVRVTSRGIVILDKIFFVTNKAIIKPVSYPLLDAIAETLQDQPEILLVEIQGHTDERGSDQYNYQLSDRRANSVRQYLVGKGVDPKRLVAKGYGESRPKCRQHTPACWSQNRRVEFIILKRKGD
ncbi:MAG: OmpA family protein [Deltaproteobacteria bacterium]|nr:OmpA family protein [Deltaproteobacteria bacterium]